MDPTQNQSWHAERQRTFNRQEANDNFCKAYARLAAQDRRKVMRLVERLAYGKTGTPEWDQWTADDLWAFYLKLQPISQTLANYWRRWASQHLKPGLNCRLAIIVLVDSMVCQMWTEAESEA